MVERKLYKTKLCVLYQRGHCPRQTCSFAHGDVELRGFSSSFNGRRDYRGNDLRDRLDGRRSPHQKYSPEREGRGHHAYHGYSSSRSIEEKSDRKRRKKQLLDGRSDFSGGLKISDGTDDRVKELKISSSDSKDVYAEQLMQVQSDIDVLEDHKCQLEMYLEEKAQEADSLTSKIQELESQLYKEKEECKRLTSKIKKFVKAHNRHSRLNDELKRSQARLDKLGDHLVLDITKVGAFEEDSSINIVSDEDTTGNHVTSPRYQLQDNTSPSKKSHINLNASKDSKSANLTNGEGYAAETTIRSQRRSRWTEVVKNGNDAKRKRRNNVPSTDKVKGLEMGIVLPSTSMAAHAVDESIEADEVGGYKVGGVELPLPPPPPLPKNATYLQQYENVDVEGLEEEAVDVDIV